MDCTFESNSLSRPSSSFASSNPWNCSSDASSTVSFRMRYFSSRLFFMSPCSFLEVSSKRFSRSLRSFSRVALRLVCSFFKAWPSSSNSSFKALISSSCCWCLSLFIILIRLPFASEATAFASLMSFWRSFLTCSKLVSKAFLKASRSASSLSCTAFSQWAFKSCSSWSSFSWSLAGESFCSLSREACSSCRDSSRADNFDASAKLGSSSSFPLWVSMVRSSSSHLLSRVHKRGMTSCPSPLMRSSSALLEDSICFSKPFTVLSTTPKSLSRSDISFRLT
mmetsp:Transcript_39531/g.84405  ORF Transcript_39531/g.84405 Transcript_39531/m.84405 type:complete len:280 (+) Transcript_39531:557-1396(+)